MRLGSYRVRTMWTTWIHLAGDPPHPFQPRPSLFWICFFLDSSFHILSSHFLHSWSFRLILLILCYLAAFQPISPSDLTQGPSDFCPSSTCRRSSVLLMLPGQRGRSRGRCIPSTWQSLTSRPHWLEPADKCRYISSPRFVLPGSA